MKLLKLFLLLLTVAPMAMALNFYGVQSINGLNSTQIFSAPVPGTYFVNGQLTLPWPTGNGNIGQSNVVATVSKNGATLLYTGLSGASGFQINQIVLSTGDLITVGLASSSTPGQTVSPDLVTNAVRGQVFFGNSF